MAPHTDARTWAYGAVSRRTLIQVTAVANYMLPADQIHKREKLNPVKLPKLAHKLGLSTF